MAAAKKSRKKAGAGKATRKAKDKKPASASSASASSASTPAAVPERTDPWKALRSPYGGRLSQAEELKRLDKHPLVAVGDEAVAEAQRVKAPHKALGAVEMEAVVAALAEQATVRARQGEGDLGGYWSLAGCGIEAARFAPESAAWSAVVSLDLSGNVLKDTSCRLGGTNCFLRSLNLANNQLADLGAVLQPMPTLLVLDVSGNALAAGGGAALGALAKAAPNLRDLRCRGCALDSAGLASLTALSALESLDLAMNAIADASALQAALDPLQKRLRALWAQGNPISELEYAALAAWIRKHCPCMQALDGARQEHRFRTIQPEDMRRPGDDDGGAGALVQDSASCSCLEGNPCAVAYNCKDWENRFAVAKEARGELGYQLAGQT